MYKDFTNYEIYEDGRIWSYFSNKFLKPQTDKGGYQIVSLSDNVGKKKTYKVHRIVYQAVTSKPIPEGLEVNHIDEDKTNNHISNLNLMTTKENCNWGTRNKRVAKARSKQVGAFKNGELVMAFQSTREAGRNGFNQGAVSACCNGKLPHYKGYTWKYL